MATCELQIELDQDPAALTAGSTVSGTLVLFHAEPVACELAVLSLVAVEMVRSDREWRPPHETGLKLPPLDGAGPTRVPFNLELPGGPLSYEGRNYALSWVLRARLWTQDDSGARTELPLKIGAARGPRAPAAVARKTLPASQGRAHPIAIGVSVFVSLAVMAAAATATFVYFPELDDNRGERSLVLLLAMVAGAVAGAPVFAVLAALFRVDLGAPTLSVSPGVPQPGDRLQVQLDLSAPAPIGVREVTLRVACEERTRRTRADGSYESFVAVLWERSATLPGGALLSPGEQRSFTREVSLPPDAPGSMSGEHAQVCWYAEATVHAARLGRWNGRVDFPLGAEAVVLPHAPTPPAA